MIKIDESWPKSLMDEGQKILESLGEDSYYPETENVFRVFNTPLNEIRVVILGQDPYPNPDQATGYAFAVPNYVKPPFSLKMIKDEARSNVSNDLHEWIEQGVFLLNSALTVHKRKAGSHLSIWKDFVIAIVKTISIANPCVWFLWGNHAQEFSNVIQKHVYGYAYPHEHNVNVVLRSPHPAAEAYKRNAGFIGCNHFTLVDRALKSINKQLINW